MISQDGKAIVDMNENKNQKKHNKTPKMHAAMDTVHRDDNASQQWEMTEVGCNAGNVIGITIKHWTAPSSACGPGT